jgi:hypothetical protein
MLKDNFVDATGKNEITVTSKSQPYVTFKSLYKLQITGFLIAAMLALLKKLN